MSVILICGVAPQVPGFVAGKGVSSSAWRRCYCSASPGGSPTDCPRSHRAREPSRGAAVPAHAVRVAEIITRSRAHYWNPRRSGRGAEHRQRLKEADAHATKTSKSKPDAEDAERHDVRNASAARLSQGASALMSSGPIRLWCGWTCSYGPDRALNSCTPGRGRSVRSSSA